MNERIRILRKELGITLEKFGERLGVSRAAMSNIENGNRNVTEQMFKAICREFNVNEEWLRNATGEMFAVPEDETAALVSDLLEDSDDEFYSLVLEAIRTYKQLRPESREVFQNICRDFLDNVKNRKD